MPPSTPVDRDGYIDAGLPWFHERDADAQDLAQSKISSNIEGVDEKPGTEDDQFVPVDPKTVIAIGVFSPDVVADGEW
ncbi:hypothetical protein MARA_29500 [Mycolicibacterium arabiense]|uniref:Uncharacterized protein n=1 Tax=Mycolicibacterium arabiense TaxID=1286181 RepID=A0A7I7RXX9_9MYCO|nr:hypothetical protein [Mycolicibacterium arabiense]MCV7374233.1 hypothetical protein [Mycolicibacterium arabiense]BBY49482.1 hypothetical protein MARA_29500 [Mycolicibacterium arabiense]